MHQIQFMQLLFVEQFFFGVQPPLLRLNPALFLLHLGIKNLAHQLVGSLQYALLGVFRACLLVLPAQITELCIRRGQIRSAFRRLFVMPRTVHVLSLHLGSR